MLYSRFSISKVLATGLIAVVGACLPVTAMVALADSPAVSSTPSATASPDPGASAVASAFASVSPDTGALAINTSSGSSVFALAFDIKFITGNTVAPTNVALAYSSCNACQTVAISIQVVIYENGATNVSPQNAAIAINNACNLCDTLASAYQIVIGESGPVRLTEQGLEQIAEIRRRLLALQHAQGLTSAQIQAQLQVLMDRLTNVLQTQLVPVKDEHGDHNHENEGSGGITLIAPTPTTRPYTPPSSPSPSASPAGSPSPAASAAVSPTP